MQHTYIYTLTPDRKPMADQSNEEPSSYRGCWRKMGKELFTGPGMSRKQLYHCKAHPNRTPESGTSGALSSHLEHSAQLAGSSLQIAGNTRVILFLWFWLTLFKVMISGPTHFPANDRSELRLRSQQLSCPASCTQLSQWKGSSPPPPPLQ